LPTLLSPHCVEEAAQLLALARLDNRIIDEIPSDLRPSCLADAYAIQDSLAKILGWEINGWFCACTNPVIQSVLKLNEPYCARLFKKSVVAQPATLDAKKYPPIVLECEFGFQLGSNLPVRATPYSRVEVETAIAKIHPTIEVVIGHLRNWPEQDVWSVIADNGTDGQLVYGSGVSEWRNLDLVNMQVSLSVNGRTVRSGVGQRVLGDPLDAFVWLVNAVRLRGYGLRAGHVYNTGTATDIMWLQPGEQAVATFHGLGLVAFTLSG